MAVIQAPTGPCLDHRPHPDQRPSRLPGRPPSGTASPSPRCRTGAGRRCRSRPIPTRRSTCRPTAGAGRRHAGARLLQAAAELLLLHPPHVTDWSMLARLGQTGLRPGERLDYDAPDPAVRGGLRGPAAGLALRRQTLPHVARVVNGWQMHTDPMGVYGNVYLERAIVAMAGWAPTPPEDAVYPLNVADADGFQGANPSTGSPSVTGMPSPTTATAPSTCTCSTRAPARTVRPTGCRRRGAAGGDDAPVRPRPAGARRTMEPAPHHQGRPVTRSSCAAQRSSTGHWLAHWAVAMP